MKRFTLILIATGLFSLTGIAQDQKEMVSKCALSVGENTTYLKDYVIKLPKAGDPANLPVYKADFLMMKKQSYRFTMCNAETSSGELILALYDKDKLVITSKVGDKVYNSFDFTCNKTGKYTLWYTFKEGQPGMGVGIVSLLK
jgi:hypothetical protein